MAVPQGLCICPQAHVLERKHCRRGNFSDSVDGRKASVTQMRLHTDAVRAHLECLAKEACLFALDNISQESAHILHSRQICALSSGPPPHLQETCLLGQSKLEFAEVQLLLQESFNEQYCDYTKITEKALTHHQDPGHVTVLPWEPPCPPQMIKHRAKNLGSLPQGFVQSTVRNEVSLSARSRCPRVAGDIPSCRAAFRQCTFTRSVESLLSHFARYLRDFHAFAL